MLASQIICQEDYLDISIGSLVGIEFSILHSAEREAWLEKVVLPGQINSNIKGGKSPLELETIFGLFITQDK